MKPQARVVAIALLALLALLAALLLLGRQVQQARQAELQLLRETHLLGNLRSDAENNLATGLRLEQLEVLQQIVAREQTAFAGVLAIDIYSAAGTVLYSTDLAHRGAPVPADWRERLAQPQPWRSQAPGLRQIGGRFDNDLGQAAGGIVVSFATAPVQPALAQWYARGQQVLHWLALLALAGLATAAALYAGLRRLLAPWDRAARILQGAPAETETAPDTALAQAARQRRAHWEAERQRCQQGLRQLEALDHEG